MIAPVFIVAFTGNRPSEAAGRSPEEIKAARPLLEEAFAELRELAGAQGGELHLFVSAAEGADVLAGEVALGMGMPVHVILPFAEEEFSKDFSAQSWAASKALIDQAREARNGATLRVTAGNGSGERSEAFAECNQSLLLAADALVTLTNGEDTGLVAGAAHLLKQADLLGLPRLAINTLDLEKGCEAKHLDCFANPKFRGAAMSVIGDLKKWEAELPVGRETLPGNPCEAARVSLERVSEYHKEKTSAGMQSAIWLHGIASIIAGLGVSYALAGCPGYKILLLVLSIVEFGLIVAAEVIHKKHHKNHHSEAWIKSRFGAELLRAAEIYLKHGDPLLPPVARLYPSWRRFQASALLRHPQVARSNDLETEREAYLKERLEDQIGYFSRHRDLSIPKARRLSRRIKWLTYGALTTVLLAIVYKFAGKAGFEAPASSWLELPLYLLPIALPLLAGIYSALRVSTDVARRALRYDHMIGLLEKAHERILTAPTRGALSAAIMETEQTLLEELNEFQLVQKVSLDH